MTDRVQYGPHPPKGEKIKVCSTVNESWMTNVGIREEFLVWEQESQGIPAF